MYYYGNSWGIPHMYGWGFGFLGIIFWIFVVYIFIKMLRNSNWHHDGRHAGKEAMDILKERYAKGEIDKKEFEEKKKDLV
jgi:putative membrane protein